MTLKLECRLACWKNVAFHYMKLKHELTFFASSQPHNNWMYSKCWAPWKFDGRCRHSGIWSFSTCSAAPGCCTKKLVTTEIVLVFYTFYFVILCLDWCSMIVCISARNNYLFSLQMIVPGLHVYACEMSVCKVYP